MFYVVGSNLESKYHNASEDLYSIINTEVDLSCTNVVVCAGGARSWDLLPLKSGETGTFALTGDRGGLTYKAVSDRKKRSMGEPSVLTEFLRYCYHYYPAGSYSLILWDHGGGPILGFGEDEAHGDDGLTMQELMHALEESPFKQNNKLEIIGFDACLMGSLEVAAAMAPYAKYMIASEEATSLSIWDYSVLADSCVREPDTETLVDRFCKGFYYKSYVRNMFVSDPSIICGYRLQEAKDACDKLDAIFKKKARKQSDYVATFRNMRNKGVKAATAWGEQPNYDLYDVASFAQSLRSELPTEANQLLKALDRMILCRYALLDGENLGGVSFYFPLRDKQNRSICIAIYNRFSGKISLSNYQGFLNQYRTWGFAPVGADGASPAGEPLTGRAGDVSWRVPSNAAADEPENVRLFEAEMSGELQSTLVDSGYTILKKEGKDRFRLVETGTGLTQTGNVLQAALAPKVLSVSGGAGTRWQPLAAAETVRGEGSIRYMFPFILTRDGENRKLNATLTVTPETPGGVITMVRQPQDGQMPSPVTEALQPGDSLWLLRPLRECASDTPDTPGSFEEWLDIPEGAQSDMPVTVGKDGLLFSREPFDPQAEYFVQLYAVDVNGNTYATSLMPFSPL